MKNLSKQSKWAILIIALLLTAIFYYKNHFMHLYAYYKLNIGHVQDLPCTELAEVAIPQDWKPQEIGKLTFRLPDGFKESDRTKEMKASGIPGEKPTALFKDKMVIIFNTTFDTNEFFDHLYLDRKYIFDDSNLTWPKFLLNCYQFKSSNFSWLKSPQLITQDTYYLLQNNFSRWSSDEKCLYHFKSRIDWIAIFSGNERSVRIFWQETGSSLGGSIVVDSKSGPLDRAWIESFCQSLDIKKD